MKYANLKKLINGSLTSASVVISIMSITEVKPVVASTLQSSNNLYSNFTTRCQKSVPEPHAVIGIITMGILGGGCLLKWREKTKAEKLNHNISLEINDVAIDSYQEIKIIPFIKPDEIKLENHHLNSALELQLIEPK